MTKKRTPRKGTHPYLVSGPVPGFHQPIHEWTNAMNEGQALRQIEERLKEKHHVPIYLGDCTVTKGEE